MQGPDHDTSLWALIAGLVGVGSSVGLATLTARREGISLRAWLIRQIALPLVVRRSKRSLKAFHARLTLDRANGPALPSAKTRSRHDFVDGVVGGTRAFRLNGASRSRRRILYLHGGAFVFDFMPAHWTVVAALVDRTGADVVAPLYPLAPESGVAMALPAVEQVYRALVAEGGAGNLVIAGDSAGAGLALALAHRLRDTDQPTPMALVLISPWLDVRLEDAEQLRLAPLDPILSVVQLREAGKMWAGALDPTDPRASPLFADQTGLPPTLVQAGTRDLLVSDARRFALRCPDAVVREYAGMFHGWIAAPIPEASEALDEAAQFMQANGWHEG